jgi:hypothetical protein
MVFTFPSDVSNLSTTMVCSSFINRVFCTFTKDRHNRCLGCQYVCTWIDCGSGVSQSGVGYFFYSDQGEKYALRLADFVHKRLKTEATASIWTSTLQRTLLTARHIVGFPKVQWRALDEINAGVCDGMTYLEIKETMPEDYQARKQDKLRYRYPRGESYLDVIQRLEPVIIELERQRSPVVVIAHQVSAHKHIKSPYQVLSMR